MKPRIATLKVLELPSPQASSSISPLRNAFTFSPHTTCRLYTVIPGALPVAIPANLAGIEAVRVMNLASRQTVTGTVPDLEPWYARTRVCVAPLLAGAAAIFVLLFGKAAR